MSYYAQGLLTALVKLGYAEEITWLPGKYKLKEKSIKRIEREFDDPKWIMQPKIDGVGVAVRFYKDRVPDVYTAEPKLTGPRRHTEKIPELWKVKPSEALHNTIIRGELFAVDKATGHAIPAKDIIGIINAIPAKSIARQEEKNIALKIAPLSVVRWQGKDVRGLPFKEHLNLLSKLQAHLDRNIFVRLPQAREKEDKIQLFEDVRNKRFPLTSEGVVFHHEDLPKEPAVKSTIKAKFRPDYDVYVRRIFAGQGEAAGKRAGGFEYSWTPDGPIVGRVGTGFDHKTLEDMLRHPNKYIGRVAKVRSAGLFAPNGALRAPSFKEWHLEKGVQHYE